MQKEQVFIGGPVDGQRFLVDEGVEHVDTLADFTWAEGPRKVAYKLERIAMQSDGELHYFPFYYPEEKECKIEVVLQKLFDDYGREGGSDDTERGRRVRYLRGRR